MPSKPTQPQIHLDFQDQLNILDFKRHIEIVEHQNIFTFSHGDPRPGNHLRGLMAREKLTFFITPQNVKDKLNGYLFVMQPCCLNRLPVHAGVLHYIANSH